MNNKVKLITGITAFVVLAIGIQTARYFQLKDGIQVADSKYNETIEKIDVKTEAEIDGETEVEIEDKETSDNLIENELEKENVDKEQTDKSDVANQEKTDDANQDNHKTETSKPSEPAPQLEKPQQSAPVPEQPKPQPPAPQPKPQGPQDGDIRQNGGKTEMFLDGFGWVEYSPGGTIEIVDDVTLSGNQIGH